MLIIKNNNIEFKDNSNDLKGLCDYYRIKKEIIYIPNNTPFSIKWNTEPRPENVETKYPKLDYLNINIFPFSCMPLFCFEEDKVIQGFLDSVSVNFGDKLLELTELELTEIEQVFFENGIELNKKLALTLNDKYNKKELIENYLKSDERYKEYGFSLKKCYLEMQEEIYDKLNSEIIKNIQNENTVEIDLFFDVFLDILVATEDYIFTEYILGYVFETEFKGGK